jgi:hypothetical protein
MKIFIVKSFQITSPNIKPFRSVTRGYTGPTDGPAIREHYSFSIDGLKENYEKSLIEFTRNIHSKSEFEITQFIRGTHYTWIDFLMTQSYSSIL